MNKYRTHTCSELTKDNSGNDVVLSGWINKKRDHGNLLFIDLRDNYGMTQCIIDKSNENFKDDDFYVGKSNFYAFEVINKWPKWEKNFLNINGEKFSGKTHLVNIFLKKFNGIRIDINSLTDENLKFIKPYQNIILEDLNLDINEKLIYSLFNIIDLDNKFLIITSTKPISEINFQLEDLRSRTKNCLFANIQNPDDELMFALILKNLSDKIGRAHV